MFVFDNTQHEKSFNLAYDTIMKLSYAQGCYSRLRMEMEYEEWYPLYNLTSEVYFENPLDFILYIEN